MHPHRLVIAALVATSVFVAACGSPRASATPTPTKTPPSAPATNTPALLPTETPTPLPPTPTPTPSNLAPFTGLPVTDTAVLKSYPIFICVNNDAMGRSQHYGLSQADLVYEYIVDGFALTRLTAMYQSQSPGRVGPVRSARLPNIKMLYSYDGILACSGGSDAVRYMLKNEVGFPYFDADLDDPSNTVYITSIGTDWRTRMQTTPDSIRRWIADKLAACQTTPDALYCQKVITNWTGGDGTINEWSRPGFLFDETPGANSAGEATTIDITYPGGNSVEWRYDPALGGYLRFQGGQQSIDPGTGEPVVASNVIVAAATHTLTNIIEDTNGTFGVDVQLWEFGDLRVFRDGLVYEGTWRADDKSPPRWLGAGEAPIPLKPGQSWVQVVQQIPDISYQ